MKIPQNLQNIISHIGGADLLGEDPTQIDSRKEYNLLGQYLNGSYSIKLPNFAAFITFLHGLFPNCFLILTRVKC